MSGRPTPWWNGNVSKYLCYSIDSNEDQIERRIQLFEIFPFIEIQEHAGATSYEGNGTRYRIHKTHTQPPRQILLLSFLNIRIQEYEYRLYFLQIIWMVSQENSWKWDDEMSDWMIEWCWWKCRNRKCKNIKENCINFHYNM